MCVCVYIYIYIYIYPSLLLLSRPHDFADIAVTDVGDIKSSRGSIPPQKLIHNRRELFFPKVEGSGRARTPRSDNVIVLYEAARISLAVVSQLAQ